MTRDTKGNIAWSALALVFGIIVIVPMVVREIYQSIKGNFSLEWNDIIRYGLLIGIFSVFHWCLIENVFPTWHWIFCL